MKDDYVHLFVKRPLRRSPIINRGYFSRWAAFRKLLAQFLESGPPAQPKKQILSLGAGFDTTYFQLLVPLFFFLLPLNSPFWELLFSFSHFFFVG